MASLDIRPHSRRISGLAVAALSLVAGGSFALGLAHQLAPTGPSPFPAGQEPTPQSLAAIPEATPAPALQVAAVVPPPKRPARPAAVQSAPADDQAATTAPAADTPPALDAAATAPEPAPAPNVAPDNPAPPTA